MASSSPLYVAIDVGTGSVRAALFTHTGKKLRSAERAIKTYHPRPHHYEQSTQDIWRSTVHCLRTITQELMQPCRTNDYIAAIGIDATCSLVVCQDDDERTPLRVTFEEGDSAIENTDDKPNSDDIYNVILWLDRRSMAEAAYINAMEDADVKSVVMHFGGLISPENEPPKLLWLLRHKAPIIRKGIFFDLADWLAFKLTGRFDARSSCTLACKWGWGSDDTGDGMWNTKFWRALGLDDLVERNFAKMGRHVISPGSVFGTVEVGVARELGLEGCCIVASPMIDAYAGCLWSLGVDMDDSIRKQGNELAEACSRLNMVCGTSTCFLQMNPDSLFVSGVWGPFRDAIMHGFHVTEGGQSVTGKLMENVVQRHASYAGLKRRIGDTHVYDVLAEMTESIVRDGGEDPATDVHCLDYHAGNRSPIGDATLTGCLTGLTLESGEWDLAVKFRATVQALCYGARHVVEEMRKGGHDMKIITACGGVCKSRMFLTELTDCLGLPVVLSSEEDTVLLGGAILARTAHHMQDKDDSDKAMSLFKTSEEMSVLGDVILPNKKRRAYHDRKYRVYREMHADYVKYRRIMHDSPTAKELKSK